MNTEGSIHIDPRRHGALAFLRQKQWWYFEGLDPEHKFYFVLLALEGPPSSLKVAVERYLAAQQRLQRAGEITLRHYKSMEWTLNRLSSIIGPTKTIARLTSADYGAWRAAVGATNPTTQSAPAVTRRGISR